MYNKKYLQEYLECYLHKHKMSLYDLSKHIGVQYHTIYSWYNGTTFPSYENQKLLSKKIGIEFNELNYNTNTILVNNIKCLLEENNITIVNLSSAINVSYQKLMRFLSLQIDLSNDKVNSIAEFFDVPVDKLVNENITEKKFDTLKNVFASNLRDVMTKKGIHRTDFCLNTGISNASLQTYLNAVSLPSDERLQKIIEYLDITDTSELFDSDEQKKKNKLTNIISTVPSDKENEFLEFANRLAEILN